MKMKRITCAFLCLIAIMMCFSTISEDYNMYDINPNSAITVVERRGLSQSKENAMKYRRYYIEGCENPKVTRQLYALLTAHSKAFSLVYCQYGRNEKYSRTTQKIERKLKNYEIDSREVKKWPGTETLDERSIYKMVTYRIDEESLWDIIDVFDTTKTIWDWDYPKYPMDICFYREGGLAWFYITAHERLNTLILDDSMGLSVLDIESIGVKLVAEESVDDDNLFYNRF